MERHLASFGTPAEAAVESVVFAVRTIPREPYMGLLLQAGETDFFTVGSPFRSPSSSARTPPQPRRLVRRSGSRPRTT